MRAQQKCAVSTGEGALDMLIVRTEPVGKGHETRQNTSSGLVTIQKILCQHRVQDWYECVRHAARTLWTVGRTRNKLSEHCGLVRGHETSCQDIVDW